MRLEGARPSVLTGGDPQTTGGGTTEEGSLIMSTHVLDAYCMPGALLGTEGISVKKRENCPHRDPENKQVNNDV